MFVQEWSGHAHYLKSHNNKLVNENNHLIVDIPKPQCFVELNIPQVGGAGRKKTVTDLTVPKE
jgi:hypothetical protein